MNDQKRLAELSELRKIAESIKDLPQLLGDFSRLKFRITWLLRQESIPRWMIPSFDPRMINIVTDVLSVIETRITQRGNLSSPKVSSPADTEL